MKNTTPIVKIFSCTESKVLAEKIAKAYGTELGKGKFFSLQRW